MFWIFSSLVVTGSVLCLLVGQRIVNYGFPFAYCLTGIIASSLVCLTQFGNHDTNFDWYGYLAIVFIVETWYLYRYFLPRSQ